MFVALSEKRQKAELAHFLRRCRSSFGHHESGKTFDFFRRSSECSEYDDYGLSIFKNTKSLGLVLEGYDYMKADGPMRPVLKFATYSSDSGLGRTAGILASNSNGRVALLHSGLTSTHGDRGRPTFGKVVRVGTKSYHFVSYLNDARFLARLVRFHRSRGAQAVSSETKRARPGSKRLKPGYDPGTDQGGHRRDVVYEARHHKITVRLRELLEQKGWLVDEVSSVSPDLVVKRGNQKILFEIKPSGASHDLMMGVVQLLLYNRFVRADQTCLVAAAPTKSDLSSAINEFIIEQNIDFLEYYIAAEEIIFDQLGTIVG